MVYITNIRMSSGGTSHEHIASVKWRNPADGATGENTISAMVNWIEKENGVAKVTDGHRTVSVGVVNHTYLRTFADNVWSDNLLALPRY